MKATSGVQPRFLRLIRIKKLKSRIIYFFKVCSHLQIQCCCTACGRRSYRW